MCLKELENKIKKLKDELGIDKNVENWENLSVNIIQIRSGKQGKLRSIALKSSTPYKKPKGRAVYLKSFPISESKERIKETEEYKKAKTLVNIIKAYWYLKDVL